MSSLESIAISEAELAPFVNNPTPAGRAQALLRQQQATWELLRRGYATLETVRTRRFEFDGFEIQLQFNPGRLTSTAAKVDSRSIQERRCFLCPANLPPGQRGLVCQDEYLLLGNPFPIFPEHFTIALRQHTPQRIADTFGVFLRLTRELGERYVVFYNGPKCGASAPDHLHFQAGNRAFLPLDAEYADLPKAPAQELFASADLGVYRLENDLRQGLAFASSNPKLLERAFSLLYRALQAGSPGTEEPLLSLLGFYDAQNWRLFCFPRARHRPSFYFKEGEAQLLISPASVELGGVCTTPRERDFERVTREHLIEMYREVCVAPERLAQVQAQLVDGLKS